MRFGPLGIWEILVIVGVALLIFGPTLLPKIARGVGNAVQTARDLKDEVTGAVLDDEAPKRAPRRPEVERVDAEPAPQGRADTEPAPPPSEATTKASGQKNTQDS